MNWQRQQKWGSIERTSRLHGIIGIFGLTALALGLVLPANAAVVSVVLEDQNGVQKGNGVQDVPVGGGFSLIQLGGGRTIQVRINNLGRDDCPGGVDAVGAACDTGRSVKWQVDTQRIFGGGVLLSDRQQIGVSTPTTLCECDSTMGIQQCCGTRLFIARGGAAANQTHTLEFVAEDIPTLSDHSLLLLCGLLTIAGCWLLLRKRKTVGGASPPSSL